MSAICFSLADNIRPPEIVSGLRLFGINASRRFRSPDGESVIPFADAHSITAFQSFAFFAANNSSAGETPANRAERRACAGTDKRTFPHPPKKFYDKKW